MPLNNQFYTPETRTSDVINEFQPSDVEASRRKAQFAMDDYTVENAKTLTSQSMTQRVMSDLQRSIASNPEYQALQKKVQIGQLSNEAFEQWYKQQENAGLENWAATPKGRAVLNNLGPMKKVLEMNTLLGQNAAAANLPKGAQLQSLQLDEALAKQSAVNQNFSPDDIAMETNAKRKQLIRQDRMGDLGLEQAESDAQVMKAIRPAQVASMLGQTDSGPALSPWINPDGSTEEGSYMLADGSRYEDIGEGQLAATGEVRNPDGTISYQAMGDDYAVVAEQAGIPMEQLVENYEKGDANAIALVHSARDLRVKRQQATIEARERRALMANPERTMAEYANLADELGYSAEDPVKGVISPAIRAQVKAKEAAELLEKMGVQSQVPLQKLTRTEAMNLASQANRMKQQKTVYDTKVKEAQANRGTQAKLAAASSVLYGAKAPNTSTLYNDGPIGSRLKGTARFVTDNAAALRTIDALSSMSAVQMSGMLAGPTSDRDIAMLQSTFVSSGDSEEENAYKIAVFQLMGAKTEAAAALTDQLVSKGMDINDASRFVTGIVDDYVGQVDPASLLSRNGKAFNVGLAGSALNEFQAKVQQGTKLAESMIAKMTTLTTEGRSLAEAANGSTTALAQNIQRSVIGGKPQVVSEFKNGSTMLHGLPVVRGVDTMGASTPAGYVFAPGSEDIGKDQTAPHYQLVVNPRFEGWVKDNWSKTALGMDLSTWNQEVQGEKRLAKMASVVTDINVGNTAQKRQTDMAVKQKQLKPTWSNMVRSLNLRQGK